MQRFKVVRRVFNKSRIFAFAVLLLGNGSIAVRIRTARNIIQHRLISLPSTQQPLRSQSIAFSCVALGSVVLHHVPLVRPARYDALAKVLVLESRILVGWRHQRTLLLSETVQILAGFQDLCVHAVEGGLVFGEARGLQAGVEI